MKKMIIATILPLLFVNSFAFQVSPDIYSVDISSDWGGVEFPNLDSSGVINIDDRRLKGDGDKSFYENTIMRIGNYRPVPDVIFRSFPNTVSENDVDNHEILTEAKKNKNWLTSDHIPSYKAVKEFLRVKNVYGYYKDGYLPIKNSRNDNLLLANNLTGVFIVSNEHRKYSITFGGNNFKDKIEEDAKNLLKATVRDIAFMANKLGDAKDDYLKSAPYIIKRNFYLCLYEIGDNYDYEKLAQ